ncbi:uncharacterized protein LOC123322624 [Coccinella septempunctata]|uniref:uncharacterized protein LOC123322624 n=1 Tax=Coccinella septempunctata TaxID=41139 RepID=UPI001D0771F3|nr:uncharacterized protein LOC123322624 [Coccinella septempunctata]
MAYRFNTNHVCSIAKSAIQQAKESLKESPTIFLRPTSRDVRHLHDLPYNFNKRGATGKEKFVRKDSNTRIRKGVSFTNVANKQIRNNVMKQDSSNRSSNYFRNENNVNEEVLGQRSISHEYSKAIHPHPNFAKLLKEKDDVNLVAVHNLISIPKVNSELNMKRIDMAPNKYRSQKCFCLSYSEVLKENFKKEDVSRFFSGYSNGGSEKNVDEMKLLSTKPLEPKLFGSMFSISPIIGPQNLRGHFVNLRCISGVMRSNTMPSRISIRKNTKKKKRLPKLFADRCTNINYGTPPLRHVPLRPLKKRCNPQEPIKCEKKLKREPCERADDDWKLEAKPFSVISYSPRISIEVKMKPNVPMKRLPKMNIPEPKRSCEVFVSTCPTRSDMNAGILKKKLPRIQSGMMRTSISQNLTAPPLRRLKKIDIPEPPKICPKEICERKECLSFTVCKKTLPRLSSSKVTAPIPQQLKNNPPLKRLPSFHIEDPPKILLCRKSQCPPRADELQMTDRYSKKKKLPKLLGGEYKIKPTLTEQRYISSLKPPVKTYEPVEPPKVCPKVACDPLCRTDSHLNIPKKSLPKIPTLPRGSSPITLKEGNSLKRLKKVLVKEPPKICPTSPCLKTYRADSKMSMKKRPLPKLEVGSISPPKTSIPNISPLKRLPKIPIEEPRRICPVEIIEKCPERNSPVPEKRVLPILKRHEKSRPPIVELKNSPSLKRLKPLEMKNDARKCITEAVISQECFRSDFADWSFPVENAMRNSCHQRKSRSVSSRRSMSTNLTDHYTKGLLTRKMLQSHIDVRKRLSLPALTDESQKTPLSRCTPKSISQNFSDDSSMKELQPKYPLYSKFKGIAPMKPDAPKLDPEKEDDCIREKCNIPKATLTASCDNPNPKRKYLRVSREETGPCPPCDSGCAEQPESCDGVINCCSSPPCKSDCPSPCPQLFSPKCPTPRPCPSPCPPPCPPPCPCNIPYPAPCPPPCPPPCPQIRRPCTPCRPPQKFRNPCQPPKKSFWQRLKNYFKARPNCPTPAQLKRKKMMTKVQKMADKAGLGVYDPCDDPRRICKEVERRCCLARKCSSSNKRCFHCYGALRDFHSAVQIRSGGLLPTVGTRNLLGSYCTSFFQLPWCRTMKNWRNPFEFYEIQDGDDFIHGSPSNKLIKVDKSQMMNKLGNIFKNLNTLQAIDVDLLGEILYKSLILHCTNRDDEFRLHVNYLLEYSPECLEKKRDILLEILNTLGQEIYLKKHDNKQEELDTGEPSLDFLKQLARIKTQN